MGRNAASISQRQVTASVQRPATVIGAKQQQVQHSTTSNTKKATTSNKTQQINQYPNATVYCATPVHEHHDTAFVTGAWLFDMQRVPEWMASQLPRPTMLPSSHFRAIAWDIIKSQYMPKDLLTKRATPAVTPRGRSVVAKKSLAASKSKPTAVVQQAVEKPTSTRAPAQQRDATLQQMTAMPKSQLLAYRASTPVGALHHERAITAMHRNTTTNVRRPASPGSRLNVNAAPFYPASMRPKSAPTTKSPASSGKTGASGSGGKGKRSASSRPRSQRHV
ncbi:hypothetical protein BC828DRAFT_400887 [Blastocladiella britannica]|nr:hypothetical protein BC828DRAFT_400887 [Blastocladiella britannica]